MELAARIAGWRRARGLSHRDVADHCGVTPPAVYQWEGSGDTTTTPHIKYLEKFVELLGITMERFYGDVPKPKRKPRAA